MPKYVAPIILLSLINSAASNMSLADDCPITTERQKLINAWFGCVNAAAERYAAQQEKASDIVEAAISSCSWAEEAMLNKFCPRNMNEATRLTFGLKAANLKDEAIVHVMEWRANHPKPCP